MDHSFVWQPEADDGPVARSLGKSGLWLPHLLIEPDRSGGGIRGVLDARTLVLGLLTVEEPWPSFVRGPRLTDPEIRIILGLCAAEMGCADEDKAAALAGIFLDGRLGADRALDALRRAVRIIPDGPRVRADLMVFSFYAAGTTDVGRAERLNEVAEHFPIWRRLPEPEMRNEGWVWYVGLAALTYLGRLAERDGVFGQVPARILALERVGPRLERLRTVGPGDMEAVKLE